MRQGQCGKQPDAPPNGNRSERAAAPGTQRDVRIAQPGAVRHSWAADLNRNTDNDSAAMTFQIRYRHNIKYVRNEVFWI